MHDPTPSVREQTPSAVRASRSAAFASGGAQPFLIASGAAVFMALIAPFGMGAAPLATRILYWLAVLNLGTVVGVGIARLSERWSPLGERPLVWGAAIAVAMTPPTAGLVWAATRFAFGPGSGSFGYLLGPVFVISVAMLALNLLADRKPPETHVAAAGAPAPKFLERLPPKLRGADVHAVEAEDHYLRLHTSRGSDLILMRLSDAIAELEGLEGAQTHRSWWVARDGYTEARRSDGRGSLMLKSGAEAPVSRTYAKALREAGWF